MSRQLKHIGHTLEIHLTALMLKGFANSHNVGLMFIVEAKLSVPVLYVLNQ